MKNLLTIFIGLILFSCSTEPSSTEKDKGKEKEQEANLTVESMAKRHIESKLSIPATEKYTYHIYKEHLDGDNKIDAIIVVNRFEYALKDASESNSSAKRAEIGFMGNFNYFFYYDGGLNQISPEFVVPSSPYAELKVSFQNIQSEAYKDVLIDFRIKNATYRDYFTIENHTPRRVFEWKIYSGLGEAESEAYHFELAEGTLGPVKDILVKKSILIQPEGEFDENTYEPKLKDTDELAYRFFYHPSSGKYMTKKQ